MVWSRIWGLRKLGGRDRVVGVDRVGVRDYGEGLELVRGMRRVKLERGGGEIRKR